MLCLVMLLALIFMLVGRWWSGFRYRSPGTVDYIQYWTAGRLLARGESPYDANKICPVQRQVGAPESWCVRMWNPPWILVWLGPLLVLPFRFSAIAWLVVNTGLIFVSAELVRRASQPRAPPWVSLVAVLLFAPTYFAIKHGQVSVLLLLGVAGFFHAVQSQRPIRVGMFLAFTSIKPHVLHVVGLVVIWWTVARRRWGVVVGIALVMIPTLAALSLVWPGWFSGYLKGLEQPPLYWRAPVLGSVLRTLLGSERRGLQFLPTGLALFGLLVWLVVRRPHIEWERALAPLLLLSVPTAPYGWSFDQLVLLIPQLQLWSAVARRKGTERRAATGLVVALLSILALQLAQSSMRMEEFYQLWMPWALGAVYLWSRRSG